jgi:hypothetical protein
MYILARYANFLPQYIVCYFSFVFFYIVSTQIAASRRKNLKSNVWTLCLDIAIWSLSQKGKLDFSILPIDVICFMGTFL